MFGRKRLPLDTPPLGPDDVWVVSGEFVTHFDDKQMYEECVWQREDVAARLSGFADVSMPCEKDKIDTDKA